MSEVVERESIRALDLDEKVFVRVPASIILDSDACDIRVSVYSFFAVRRGIDCRLTFSINEIREWMGRDVSARDEKTCANIKDVVTHLADNGYISVDDCFATAKNSSRVNAMFHYDGVSEECSEHRFAMLYIDEIRKITSYKDESRGYASKDVMLLLLSYLRMEMPRRSNKLRADEIGAGAHFGQTDVDARRSRHPEVYNDHYKNISDEIGVSDRLVAKYLSVLDKVGIIYLEMLPRFQSSGKWHTNWVLFCNRYKRDKNFLLAEGEEYFEKEIKAKKNLLLNYNKTAKAMKKNNNKTKASAAS